MQFNAISTFGNCFLEGTEGKHRDNSLPESPVKDCAKSL